MQATKDSFYIALRDRLVVVNPDRVVTLDGVTRPAIAVVENEPPSRAPTLCDTFYLRWGDLRPAGLAAGTLMAFDCAVSYCTRGRVENANLDRGRELASLDHDLLAICAPPRTAKVDYSAEPPLSLSSTIFWTPPALSAAKSTSPYVGREVTLTVFFYPEVNQP